MQNQTIFSMESTHQRNTSTTSSGDMFSFPNTPVGNEDSDFEFGSITPDSPSTFQNSPADHLFLNGRLLPHSFPINQTTIFFPGNSRQTSRTSSISSKDSLMSSRSNSTNSRSSSCSSARTSSSDNNYERTKMIYQRKINCKNSVSAQVYGSSQRWQFIASVPIVPVLNRENSLRKKVDFSGKTEFRGNKQGKKRKNRVVKKRTSWFGFRIFKWFVLICKECHAMEPSRKDDVLKGNVKV